MPKNGTQNFVCHHPAECVSWRMKIGDFHVSWLALGEHLSGYCSTRRDVHTKSSQNTCHACALLAGARVPPSGLPLARTSARPRVPLRATRCHLGGATVPSECAPLACTGCSPLRATAVPRVPAVHRDGKLLPSKD